MSFVGDAVSDVVGGVFGGSDAASDAAAVQSDAFGGAIDVLRPGFEAGDTARQQQMALLGLLGPEAQAAAQASIQESPSQKFMRDRQERALLRNSAATGQLGGGNVKTALQQQAAGFAQQDLQNQFGRLNQLSSQGNQFGTNIANLTGQQGGAQASGILGAQQANAGMANNLISMGSAMFSDERLKKDIKQIGTLGKLNLYSWKWKDSGKSDTGFIAQQVQKVLPQFVTEINGFLAVNYDEAIGAA